MKEHKIYKWVPIHLKSNREKERKKLAKYGCEHEYLKAISEGKGKKKQLDFDGITTKKINNTTTSCNFVFIFISF